MIAPATTTTSLSIETFLTLSKEEPRLLTSGQPTQAEKFLINAGITNHHLFVELLHGRRVESAALPGILNGHIDLSKKMPKSWAEAVLAVFPQIVDEKQGMNAKEVLAIANLIGQSPATLSLLFQLSQISLNEVQAGDPKPWRPMGLESLGKSIILGLNGLQRGLSLERSGGPLTPVEVESVYRRVMDARDFASSREEDLLAAAWR